MQNVLNNKKQERFMNKSVLLSLTTSVFALAAPLHAEESLPHGFYIGADLGLVKSKLKVTGQGKKSPVIRSYGGALKGGWMCNYGVLLYGAEIGVGYANGAKTGNFGSTSFKVNHGFNNDLVGKLGMKLGRAATYGLAGVSWAVFKLRTSHPTLGLSTKTEYLAGPVFGVGIMYDILPKISGLIEYKYAKYEDFTIAKTSPVLKMKPHTETVYVGVIYKL